MTTKKTKKGERVYMLKESQIQQIKSDSTQHALYYLMPIVLKIARDEYGFGRKRLERLMEQLMEEITCVQDGYTELLDYKAMLEEETGMVIQWEKKWSR